MKPLYDSDDEDEIRDYNRNQANAIKSYRRKMEKKCKHHLSNDIVAIHWAESNLANYYRNHYKHQVNHFFDS